MFKADLNKGMGEGESQELDMIKSEALPVRVKACDCPERNEPGHGCVIRN